ncbi:MAG: hypothetical protein PHE51_00265 [Eubacteriales bacterium]|nr:hypothetical protein [Eubacteriales bacterium]
MNKYGKIVSLVLSVAICASSMLIPVYANEAITDEIAENNDILLAAVEDFSVEKYPYSLTTAFDDESEVRDSILYNESNKYKNSLSTKAGNPSLTFGPGYNGNAMIWTAYSGHREDIYGGKEKEQEYGNAAQVSFATKDRVVYADPTTGAQVSLNLSNAVKGANKIAFWTKGEKTDRTDRVVPETFSYSFAFRGVTGSVSVKIPSDGNWHYVVADLATPIGEGFGGFNLAMNTNESGGAPALKLDGTPDAYPLDENEQYIRDIDQAYVKKDGQFVLVKAFNFTYEPDPEGIYVNIPTDTGAPVYYRTDQKRYILTKDSEGGEVYLEDVNGDYIKALKKGGYVKMPDPEVNFADKYSLANVESYEVDESGQKKLDNEGNPIPQLICGNLVKEVYSTQICIDEMLFYRTTESGGRTSFFPSREEDYDYYTNTELDSITLEGSLLYDVDLDGENRVLYIPTGFDLSAADAKKHFTVITKCPNLLYTGVKDGTRFIPIDVSETGPMKSGSYGIISLPNEIGGNAVVTVISSNGMTQDYIFEVREGLKLSAAGKDRFDRYGNPQRLFEKITGGSRDIEVTNYGDEAQHVQIVLVVRDKTTNELKAIAVDSSNGGMDVAPYDGTDGTIGKFKITIPSGLSIDENSIAHFYIVDSLAGMKKLAQPVIIEPSLYLN